MDRTEQSQHSSRGLSGCLAPRGVCSRLADSSHHSLLGGLTPDQNPAPAPVAGAASAPDVMSRVSLTTAVGGHRGRYHDFRSPQPSVCPQRTSWHNDKPCASLPACPGGSPSPLSLAPGDAVPLSSPWKGRNSPRIPEPVCLLWELRNIINGPGSMCST